MTIIIVKLLIARRHWGVKLQNKPLALFRKYELNFIAMNFKHISCNIERVLKILMFFTGRTRNLEL